MDEQCQLRATWRYRKVKQAWHHKNNPFTKKCYNLKLAKDSVMSWVHGKDEWVLNQLEDWNSKPMSCGHCSNYIGSW